MSWGINEHSCQVSSITYWTRNKIPYKVSQCNDSPSPLTISKHEGTQQQIFCGTKVFVNQSVNMVGQGGQCLHLIR